MRKLAVIFPGVGYHTDKPLLYYAKKAALSAGYEIKDISYSNLPEKIKGDEEKIRKAYEMSLEQAKDQLDGINFDNFDRIVFISKSIGTAVAATIDKEMGIKADHIYFTPVPQTFDAVRLGSGTVFHGLSDPWCPNGIVEEKCKSLKLPLYTFEQANHSIETGQVDTDLKNLAEIMAVVEKAIGI